jgi:hypothetical protein
MGNEVAGQTLLKLPACRNDPDQGSFCSKKMMEIKKEERGRTVQSFIH